MRFYKLSPLYWLRVLWLKWYRLRGMITWSGAKSLARPEVWNKKPNEEEDWY